MKRGLLLLVLLPLFAHAGNYIDSSTMPDMVLGNEDCEPINGVSASEREMTAAIKARNLGPGIYCVLRPTGTVVIKTDDVVEPEPEPAPDPDPMPEPEPSPDPVEPPVVEGPMDTRFAALLESQYLHDFLAMNNSADVCRYTRPCVNKGETNPHFTYDPEENAFKADLLGESDISSKWQIRKYFPTLDKDNSTIVSFQWEFKYSDAYLSTGLLHNYKAFQISNSGEDLMWEYQHRFSRTDATAVAIPTNRVYFSLSNSEAVKGDPLAANGPYISEVNNALMLNWQPGGDTAADYRERSWTVAQHLADETEPFLIRANTWIRTTTEFHFENGELRVCTWMSDETTGPVKVLGGVNDPDKCFLLSNNTDIQSLSFQNWWLELNSSQDGPVPGLVSWHKNFIVYKDASIPLE